jgi:PncC family amidohydrolase
MGFSKELNMAEGLEALVGKILQARRWTLAVGESCTGGLVGHSITNVAGSSDYFLGGIVAYSYEAKERLLGVSHQTLYERGAVSKETALEMALGARSALGADIGISVTGISGPGGGTPEKAVGLTWVAVSSRHGERAERHQWDGDREANKLLSAEAVLALLLKVLEENE